MFNEAKYVVINGKEFKKELFDELLMLFKEAFSHSSSSIESAFLKLDSLTAEIDKERNENSAKLFKALGEDKKNEIINVIKLMLVRLGYNYKIFWDDMPKDQEGINRLFEQYFGYFKDEIPYFIKFNEDGNFNDRETFKSMCYLIDKLPDKKVAMDEAYYMQKDNLDAFDYAISLPSISINDIININCKVINHTPDKVEGFKKTNNAILGAGFQTVDKKEVYPEMQRLMYDYENDFGMELLNPNEFGISPEEKVNRLHNIFKKEALFHIRFERIHPFTDGNGRTGRIILNHNLLKQGFAPVLITNVMAGDYKSFINNNDVDELAKMLLNSSSQLMTSWVSAKKVYETGGKNNVNNDTLAEVLGYDDDNALSSNGGKRRK